MGLIFIDLLIYLFIFRFIGFVATEASSFILSTSPLADNDYSSSEVRRRRTITASNDQGEMDGGWPCEVQSWQPVREKRERESAGERAE